MKRFIKRHTEILLCGILSLMLIAGCGSGGSSSSSSGSSGGSGSGGGGALVISGTAAGGLPIVGIVTVLGSNGGTAQSPIQTDGTYTIDVTVFTPPYILNAEGTVGNKSVKYYSAAVAPGDLNITPVTDFILKYALAGLPPINPIQVNQTALNTAQGIVQAQLAPLLEAAGIPNANLMTDPFIPGQPGIDVVLDALTFTTNGNIVTVTNNFTGSNYIDNVASPTAVVGLPITDANISAQVLADNAAINQLWDQIEALYAASLPTLDQINLHVGPLVANDYLDEGEDKTQELTSWALQGDGPDLGMTLYSTIIQEITPAPASYQKAYSINLHHTSPTNAYDTGSFITQMVYDGANWLWYGDQSWMDYWLDVASYMYIDHLGNVTYRTGLNTRLHDDNNYAYLNHGVRSIIATGPGLPVDGIVLGHMFPETHMRLYSQGERIYFPGDTAIAAIPDNALYTIRLYDVDPAVVTLADIPLHTHTHTIPKPPLQLAALTASMFPALTFPNSHSPSATNIPGILNVSWTNPSNAPVNSVYLGWSNGAVDIEVVDGSTSASLDTTTFPAPPLSFDAMLHVDGYDIFKREFSLMWLFTETIYIDAFQFSGTTDYLNGNWFHSSNFVNSDGTNFATYALGVPDGKYAVMNTTGGALVTSVPEVLKNGVTVHLAPGSTGTYQVYGGDSIPAVLCPDPATPNTCNLQDLLQNPLNYGYIYLGESVATQEFTGTHLHYVIKGK